MNKLLLVCTGGGVKSPSIGKRFSIPYVDYTDELKYADMMKTLVEQLDTLQKSNGIAEWFGKRKYTSEESSCAK
jgi:hypothetical protein